MRDAAIVAVIALLVFQSLRRVVGDYYRVPSGSMEPFLHGDERVGDVVFVDTWSSGAECGRGDVVVVQHPNDPDGQLVKRIACSGDDPGANWIDFSDGDVFLGSSAQRLTREVKDPIAARRLRVAWANWPGSPAAVAPLALGPEGTARRSADPGTTADEPLAVPPLGIAVEALQQLCRRRAPARRRNGSPVPRGFVGTIEPVDARYLDRRGARSRDGESVQVYDCGIDLALAAAVDTVALVLETRHETMTWLWQPAAGRIALWRNGDEVESAELPLRPAAGHRLEFGRLDDRYFFLVDGGAHTAFLVPRRVEWRARREPLPRGPRTRLFVAALGQRPLAISRFHVFRDIYYFRDRITGIPGRSSRWPMHVDPGHWLLLGDNAFDSHDGRQFGQLPASDYLGRPWAVLGPWPHHRWLEP